MPRYRKRPVDVDAIVWTGDNEDDVREFVLAHSAVANHARWIVHRSSLTGDVTGAEVWVERSNAVCDVELGGAVIAEPDGSGVYPCAAGPFAAGFDLVG